MTAKKKILVLGIDGMDPRFSRKMLSQGYMPNLRKLLEKGAANKNLEMIGGHPTVTPPMWTTLATGASPYVHGIVHYDRLSDDKLDTVCYNMDSRNCRAEQMWNVTAESGLKTLVWHWPGSSWPPSSKSKNLYVVDGTQPEGPNCGNAQVEEGFFVVARNDITEAAFRKKASTDGSIPCMITGMEIEENEEGLSLAMNIARNNVTTWDNLTVNLDMVANPPQDAIYSPLKAAEGWQFAIPEESKEFTVLYSGGLVQRKGLLIKENGKYSKVRLYKSKKEPTLIAEIVPEHFTVDVIDEIIVKENRVTVSRHMRIIDIDEKGESLTLYISPAMDISDDSVWSPKSLYHDVVENVGYPKPIAAVNGKEELFMACTHESWEIAADWNAAAINYLIEKEQFEVVFSHFHSIDLQGHMCVHLLKSGNANAPAESYQRRFIETYHQADRYIGKFLHLLDKGWSIFVVSDHGQICAEHGCKYEIGGDGGVLATYMQDWGYTVLKRDSEGNVLREVDLTKSKAVAVMCGYIRINLKGREPSGIVDPADKFELEEEIMTKLYSLRDEKTGHRIIQLALRNSDAILLGEGGPDGGDILYRVAEGYNFDHGDTLSTLQGFFDTSVSSIFVAAGAGIKENHLTERTVHHVDVVPTIAALLQLRMPAQCEGAPVYQILS